MGGICKLQTSGTRARALFLNLSSVTEWKVGMFSLHGVFTPLGTNNGLCQNLLPFNFFLGLFYGFDGTLNVPQVYPLLSSCTRFNRLS